jgi:hypothetical protein
VRRASLIALALLLAVAVGGQAQAEVEQQGDVIVRFDGGISPDALPRTRLAPVAVSVDSSVRSSDGTDPPPQLQRIAIAINRGGKLFDRGLPTCNVRSIQPTTIGAARQICGDAIVGSGNVHVRVVLENQPPFTFKGPMLVFNAKRSGGDRRLLAQVYGIRPAPSAFILTFRVTKRRGTFGNVIQTTLPQASRKWAYVTHFDMRLQRTYEYRGRQRSFVSAGCAAPKGFPGAVYAFARAQFDFEGDRSLTTTLVRDCTVR